MKPHRPPPIASWIIGTAVAFAGVLVTRLVAPHFVHPARAWLAVIGELGGLAGLAIIALGVRRRLRAALERDSVS
jgi:hypothetical protein